jgi:Domain of unknown function (DUF4386)
MTADRSPSTATRPATLQRYARAAGVALLLSVVFGTLGELYLPGRIIVSGDAAATAANIVAHPTLFRLSFAAYLVEGICDVALCVFFYVLLAPVDRNLALLSAFFGLASMVMYAVAQSSFYAASLVVRDTAGMGSFTADQRQALALLCLRLWNTIASLFLALYGIATMIRGWLVMRSGYLPRLLGMLFIVGGAGFFLREATLLVAPGLSSGLMLLPMGAAGIPMMVWLLVRGIDQGRVVPWGGAG